MKFDRLFLYSKDIARLTGKSERQARTTIAIIRRNLGKAVGQPITIQEYCQYAGISEAEVVRHLAKF
jgi:hypothetical protein